MQSALMVSLEQEAAAKQQTAASREMAILFMVPFFLCSI
jgi:hypothetical protein